LRYACVNTCRQQCCLQLPTVLSSLPVGREGWRECMCWLSVCWRGGLSAEWIAVICQQLHNSWSLGLSARVEAALLSPCAGCLSGRLVWLLASHSLACLGSLNNWACRRSRSWGLSQSEGCGALQGGVGSCWRFKGAQQTAGLMVFDVRGVVSYGLFVRAPVY
jgi:hypothetical protein